MSISYSRPHKEVALAEYILRSWQGNDETRTKGENRGNAISKQKTLSGRKNNKRTVRIYKDDAVKTA